MLFEVLFDCPDFYPPSRSVFHLCVFFSSAQTPHLNNKRRAESLVIIINVALKANGQGPNGLFHIESWINVGAEKYLLQGHDGFIDEF